MKTVSSLAGRDRRRERLASLWHSSPIPIVMGILNCTPDSFSDGGRYNTVETALGRAVALADQGACIVDIGGESTRPGASSVSASEESDRILPVICQLRQRRPDLVISVDTTKPEVAAEALACGADIVNDVSASCEPDLLETIVREEATLVLMHMRGNPRTMQQDTKYSHVVAEVHEYLRERAVIATAAGIPKQSIWLDPGIGFGKDDAANLALLGALGSLEALGHPIVVGASRKSFIGRLTGADTDDRLSGSLAALTPVTGSKTAVVRVHDVAETVQFLTLASQLARIAS